MAMNDHAQNVWTIHLLCIAENMVFEIHYTRVSMARTQSFTWRTRPLFRANHDLGNGVFSATLKSTSTSLTSTSRGERLFAEVRGCGIRGVVLRNIL